MCFPRPQQVGARAAIAMVAAACAEYGYVAISRAAVPSTASGKAALTAVNRSQQVVDHFFKQSDWALAGGKHLALPQINTAFRRTESGR